MTREILRLMPAGTQTIAMAEGLPIFQLDESTEASSCSRYRVRTSNGFHEECRKLTYARDLLKTQIELHLARHCKRFVFVHAGVVHWKGRAILIPGVSCAGKTSLVAAMLRAGGCYLSDEYALLDCDGRVHPFARALAVRGQAGKKYHAPDQFGAIEHRPQRIDTVLLTCYRPQGQWNPRPITSARAALEVFQNTLPAIERPQAAMQAIRAALATAQCYRGIRGETEQVISWLHDQPLKRDYALAG